MPEPSPRPARRSPYALRLIRARWRLFTGAAVAVLCVVVLPADWRLATRLLGGWDLGIAIFLLLTWRLFATAGVDDIRRHARSEDEGRIVIPLLTAAAALASLGAIVSELGTPAARGPWSLTMLMLTTVLSWTLIHTIFAVHYAHEFYDAKGGSGLAFPATKDPDYWDFVYFSLVIGMTAQVSDVEITSPSIRRTVAAHGVVSFFFNAALLALAVNIAANAMANP